jgi:hypothetical protein
MQIHNFAQLPNDIEVFKQLPTDLHHKIYEYIIYDVYNAVWFNLDWFDIINYVGYTNCLGFEYIMDKYNNMLVEVFHEKNKDKDYSLDPYYHINNSYVNDWIDLSINDDDKHDVGMFLEKVKPSIWGKRYIYFEDEINQDLASELILKKIDKFIESKLYNNKHLFYFNIDLLFLSKNLEKYEMEIYNSKEIQNNVEDKIENIKIDIEKNNFKKKIGLYNI